MEFIETKLPNIHLVQLVGRLDTKNYTDVEKQFNEVIERGEIKLLVDFADLEYISSSGLRVLLMMLKKLKAINGRFILCNLRQSIYEIFEISGFVSLFEIFPTREEALNKL